MVGLAATRARLWWPDLQACFARLRGAALQDRDHPLTGLIAPELAGKLDVGHLQRRRIPRPGQGRINPNVVVFRAAHCRRAGFPDAWLAYVTGPMRDEGEYHSAHALWTLQLLRERGCQADRALRQGIASLQSELLRAQRRTTTLSTTRAIDLYAERLLFVRLSGAPRSVLLPFVPRLLAAQRADGAFAAPGERRPHWLQHATTVAIWALSTLLPEARAPRARRRAARAAKPRDRPGQPPPR